MAVKSLNDIYAETGHNLDSSVDSNTLVSAETGAKTFGVFKFFAGIAKFLANGAKKTITGGLEVDSLTVNGSEIRNGWIKAGTATYGHHVDNIPSTARDIFLVLRSPFYFWTKMLACGVYVYSESIVGGMDNKIYSLNQCITYSYNGSVCLEYCIQDGNDSTSNAYIEVYYR